MINSSISWFVNSKEDVEVVKELTLRLKLNVQLAFYLPKDAETFMWDLVECAPYITSIHLPKDLTNKAYEKDGLAWRLCDLFGVSLLVVHPWADDLPNIVDTVRKQDWTLCLELFESKKASPFTLLSQFGEELEADHLGLCVDFSQLPLDLMNSKFILGLLPYTKMYHISNRVGKDYYLPLFAQSADLNIHKIIAQVLAVPNMPVREFTLKYMKEYRAKLVKQCFWLQSYVEQKRRKLNG